MSCNYAEGLSPYHDKGQLGLDEKFDNKASIALKADQLAKWINKAKHVVIHTGAGISTSAGIPDFRGPRGVWTLQAKGQKPDISTDFNEAVPTPTHMAIARLVEASKVKYVVSQNIDGLHLRSGLPRKYLSELHGNMFVEQCNACNRQFVRNSAVPTVGQKSLGKACPTIKPNGRACRGRLHDTILDWEHSLPENDLAMADFHSCLADLSIALGTTMQIVPSGSLPLYTKKAGGKLVIVNLQPTKHDAKADLLIHGYVDEVITQVIKLLSLKIPKYTVKNDPTKLSLSSDKYFEWTISDKATQQMRDIYEKKCGTKEAKKRLDMIDDDDVPLITRVRKRRADDVDLPKLKQPKKEEDPEVLVVEEIKPKRGRRKAQPPAQPPPPPIPPTKLTIKKNVTPTKTKYEIVPTRSEKRPPRRTYEIVHEKDDNACADLEMICESDDEGPNVFTTNFKRYLHDDKTFKREEKPDVDAVAAASTSKDPGDPSLATDIKTDIKEEEEKTECAEKTCDTIDGKPAESKGAPPKGDAATSESSAEALVQEASEAQSGATPAEEGAASAPVAAAEEAGEPVVPEGSDEPNGPEAACPGAAPSSPLAGQVPETADQPPVEPSASGNLPDEPGTSQNNDEPAGEEGKETAEEAVDGSKSPDTSEAHSSLQVPPPDAASTPAVPTEDAAKNEPTSDDVPPDDAGKVADAANIVALGGEDLPPINENLLYANSGLDLYGNF